MPYVQAMELPEPGDKPEGWDELAMQAQAIIKSPTLDGAQTAEALLQLLDSVDDPGTKRGLLTYIMNGQGSRIIGIEVGIGRPDRSPGIGEILSRYLGMGRIGDLLRGRKHKGKDDEVNSTTVEDILFALEGGGEEAEAAAEWLDSSCTCPTHQAVREALERKKSEASADDGTPEEATSTEDPARAE